MSDLFHSEYFPKEFKIRIFNKSSFLEKLDLYAICMDTNLCFYKGWIILPVNVHIDISFLEFHEALNKVGIKILLVDSSSMQIVYSKEHLVNDSEPCNFFHSDPFELSFGPWYDLEYADGDEGIFSFEESDVIYDLGANVGVFTKWALSKSDIKQAYLFEPTDKLVGFLEKTFSKNHNVQIFDKAIVGEEREADFHIFENSVGNTLLDFNGKNHTYLGVKKVECVNLEKFIKEKNLLRPTFIKMDIESSEYESLSQTSDDFFDSVKQISLEYHDNTNGQVMELIRRFLELDYKIKLKRGCSLSNLSGNLLIFR